MVCEHIRVQLRYDIKLNDAVLLFCDGFPKCCDNQIDCTICLYVDQKRKMGKSSNKLVRNFYNGHFECVICNSEAVYKNKEMIADIHFSSDDLVGSSGKSNYNIIYFLLNEVLNRLLIEQGFCAYHASSISLNEKAIIFIGESMSGKTTMSLKLASKGYHYLGDDRVFIRNGIVYSYPKPIHISHDVRSFFEEGYSNKNKKGKSYVPFSKYITDQYGPNHAKIECIFLICNDERMEKTLVRNKRGLIYGLNSLFYCEQELPLLLDSIIEMDEIPIYIFKNLYCDTQIEEINLIIKKIIGYKTI